MYSHARKKNYSNWNILLAQKIKSEFLDSSYAVSSVQKRAEFMFDEFALKLTFYISIKLNFAFSNRQKQAFYACCTLAMNSEGINIQ